MTSRTHQRAGQPPTEEDLTDPEELVRAYYNRPIELQQIVFGTGGHRGSSLVGSFNELHIRAATQAVVDYRRAAGIDGPLFVGRDTHALSHPAEVTVVGVLAENDVDFRVDSRNSWVPTPALAHAILEYSTSGEHDGGKADGIVLTPSHNPPRDGGFKYLAWHGGQATPEATDWIAVRANLLLGSWARSDHHNVAATLSNDAGDLRAVERAVHDFRGRYVQSLASVIDLEAIRTSSVKLGVDPLGGAAIEYWELIRDAYDIDFEIVNHTVDPSWAFMPLDWDGEIRMDPSSHWAMAGVASRRDEFDVIVGNDADADRHGIVIPGSGLMPANHFLAVAADYLLTNRPAWPQVLS